MVSRKFRHESSFKAGPMGRASPDQIWHRFVTEPKHEPRARDDASDGAPPDVSAVRLGCRDATAAGRLSAVRCRAALPDQAAKQAAWTAMLGGTLSGYELAATVQGFWQADQAGLLAGYVPRYFAALAEVAARGGAEVARVLCQHGFPHHAVTPVTLRAGERCLESGGLTGSLRRLLADHLEDLRRSLAVSSRE
jgi:aminopeptidase N